MPPKVSPNLTECDCGVEVGDGRNVAVITGVDAIVGDGVAEFFTVRVGVNKTGVLTVSGNLMVDVPAQADKLNEIKTVNMNRK